MPAQRQRESIPAPGQLTLILGAGAMGRLWAATLPKGTSRFLARPKTNPSPCCFQFRESSGEQRPVQVPFSTLVDQTEASCLLVTTKAPDALEALQAHLANVHENVPIVLFQNGMGSQRHVAEHWPERPILAAVTTEGANCPTPDITIHAGRGETWVGCLNPAAQPYLPEVVGTLAQSQLSVTGTENIELRLWHKLIINAGINPFTAILDCCNGDILHHPFYLEHIDALCQELHQLMIRDGIPPKAASALRHTIETVARATATNTSSMRADVQRGRPTEIGFINGYVSRRGQELGLALPVNQMLTDRVIALTNQQPLQGNLDG